MRKIKIKDAAMAIHFYLCVKQFLKMTQKIEEYHDHAVSSTADQDHVQSGLDYYQAQKAHLLFVMRSILNTNSIELPPPDPPDGKEVKPEPERPATNA